MRTPAPSAATPRPGAGPRCVVLLDTKADRLLNRRRTFDALLPGVATICIGSHRANGLAAIEALQTTQFDGPLIMIGELDSVEERISFLQAGADHVLPLPLTRSEAIAWTRSLLRRLAPQSSTATVAATFTLCPESKKIDLHGNRIVLSATEFDLMTVLVRSRGRVVSRKDLLLLVWGIRSETTTNVLNAHLWSLRRKLASIGAPRAIRTIRGVGFTLHE